MFISIIRIYETYEFYVACCVMSNSFVSIQHIYWKSSEILTTYFMCMLHESRVMYQ